MTTIALNNKSVINSREVKSRGITKGKEESFTLSTVMWLGLSLVLFCVMGPFSAIAVVPAVLSLSHGESEGEEPLSAA